jgi:hypothetical protein
MIYVTKYVSDNVMETLIRTGTVARFYSAECYIKEYINKQINKKQNIYHHRCGFKPPIT